MNIVEKAARAAWKPIDQRPPWAWAEEHIQIDKTSPFPGKYRSDTAPWTKELMEVFADNRINDISVMCSAQSAKTQTIMILLAWAIAEDPAPAMWVMAAQDEAKTFCQTRLMPTLRECKPVADLMPNNRSSIRGLEIDFTSMPLVVNGSNSPSKLQSKPIRWLFLDEVRNYPAGALEMALKRTRSFWNARRVIISTPDMESDAVHMAFLAGDQRHYYVSCPDCSHYFVLSWETIKWDDTPFTRPDGAWIMDNVAETIRCECPKCGHRIYDKPQVRRELAISGKWIPHNPNAPKNRVSFTWNALVPPWVRWRDLVEEFLEANKSLTWKDHEKLKSFVNESLGQPWADTMKDIRDWSWVSERKATYELREHWSAEYKRFLTVDVQKDHIWYLCRAWAKGGASRLVDFGKVWNFDELRQIQKDLRVNDDDVAIDSGYNATMVYSEIVKSGYRWKAFKGDRATYFSHNGVRKCWTSSSADPAIGTSMQGKMKPVKLFIWANHLTKDTLAMYMKGLAAPWEIPESASQQYLDQITAESREQLVSAKGVVSYEWVRVRKDNHAFDLECMNLICALITKVTSMPSLPEDASPTDTVSAISTETDTSEN